MSVQAIAQAPLSATPSLLGQQALTISGLSKSFTHGQSVFKEVTLQVPTGKSVAIIGANGVGKSTLLRCCVRLIEPDCGEISIAGQAFDTLAGQALRNVRANVGFIFQKHQLIPRLSVLTNVLHGGLGKRSSWRMWHQAWAPEAERERAYQMLSQVGLAHLALRRADTLSGGQSQRVAIARALMQQPSLILADEPTASLDPNAGMAVMELLQNIIQAEQIGLLMVSHNLEQTKAYCDQVIGLKDKKVALNAASDQCSAAQLRAFFDHGATHES